MKLAAALTCVALAACSATPPAGAAAEPSADAAAAIAAAKLCVQTGGGVTPEGFTVAFDEATAHRDPSDKSRWIVVFPPGHYMGRLPPPSPGSPLLLAVDPVKGGPCTTVPSTPAAP